ncbi:riboflavin kinase / FMN adenylyltransferase [Lentibacillus persicus]|uniref:FAD synthase n=1 Tax=Lentibacillus persicus TaxID=640948 RepID=A0A1I1S7B5_9BACI|nr:FAD synthetase family protein [Lentibacillus persicus]SFD42409.1 riboflavin kinase / FMN adenylyltransferase [Lentibacillus persicus]
METIYLNAANLDYWKKKSTSNVMALGFFDGIHKGHQKVIRTAVNKAKERGVAVTVMSFFPHPKTVLSKGNETFDYIMPLTEKGKVLEQLGVDTFYIVEFDKSFASLSPEAYVSNYLVDFGVEHAVAGYDFSYGKFGAGHVGRMEDDSGGKLGVTKVDKVSYQGQKISSTWIRQLLSTGDMKTLPHVLGRSYELACKLNGDLLDPLAYYTVPASGCYSVTIDNGIEQELVKVVIPENHHTIKLLDRHKLNYMWEGNVSIIWHHRVPDETAMSYSY